MQKVADEVREFFNSARVKKCLEQAGVDLTKLIDTRQPSRPKLPEGLLPELKEAVTFGLFILDDERDDFEAKEDDVKFFRDAREKTVQLLPVEDEEGKIKIPEIDPRRPIGR